MTLTPVPVKLGDGSLLDLRVQQFADTTFSETCYAAPAFTAGTPVSQAITTSSAVLLNPNLDRTALFITNDQGIDASGNMVTTGAMLYVLLGAAAASATNYSWPVPPGATLELSGGSAYGGEVRVIGSAALGNVRCQELSP